MKKSFLTIGLLTLVMILTSFTTPVSKADLSGQGATGGTVRLDLSGQGATGGTVRLDLSGQGATGGTVRLD